jgi:signal transduction histidine kinase/ligand-binding sensor domain-containing protein
MSYRNEFLITGLLFIGHFYLVAQQFPFVHYTPNDGLVNSRVHSAYQDQKGRMYFMTFGGLSVYDGSRFTNYTTTDGLAVDMVNDIIEMAEDSLWIAVNSPNVHCLVKGKIINLKTADGFHPLINKFLKTKKGELYAAGDNGLYIFEQNRFKKIQLINKKGKDVSAYLSSALEVDGLVLIQTDLYLHHPAGALYIFDPTSKKIIAEEYDSYVQYAIQSPENDIWLITNYGIKILDKKSLMLQNTFNLLPLPGRYAYLTKIKTGYLFFDKQGALWLKSKSDLLRIDTDGKTSTISTGSGSMFSILNFIYEDREGILWFCTNDEGVEKLITTNIEYSISPGYTKITDIHADPLKDSVWMYEEINQEILLFTRNRESRYHVIKPGFDVKNIIPQDNGIWLIGLEKAGWFQLTGEKVFTGKYFFKDNNAQDAYYIIRPIIDPFGNIIVTGSGLTVLLKNKRKFSLPLDNLADQVATDSHNRLWIITRNNKLIVCNINPGDPDNYLEVIKVFNKELPTNNPRSLAIDKFDNVWVGTRSGGIYYLDIKNLQIRSWKNITTKNGLTEKFIHYLYCDKDNTIWVCSPGGLDKIKIKNDEFSIDNITKSNNIYQYIHKIVENKSGTKWILTTSGIIKIHPDKPNFPAPEPFLMITELTVGNESFHNFRNNLRFSFTQNDLGFKVAAPSFYDEKQIRYSYMLKGRNNKIWSEPSNNSTINFINLQPGNYEMLVKAIFPASKYPDKIISYSFRILPPWWQTWWFKILMIFLTIGLLVLIIRSYFKGKLERQRKILEKQQTIEKERTRIALDMHDDLGAGLSTIRFLSEKVKRNTFSDITKNDIQKMADTSNELVENMNEIIWAMNEKNDTLEDLLFYTRSYAKEYCEENQLECMVYFPEKIPPVFVSGELRRNVFLTVKESLHNIIKHAAATVVTIQITLNSKLIVTISDNGQGFSISALENISGGNGLKNMRKRIESIGGDFNSLNGQGVTIKIEVPLQYSKA